MTIYNSRLFPCSEISSCEWRRKILVFSVNPCYCKNWKTIKKLFLRYMTIKNKIKWNACIMIHLASRPTLTREIAHWPTDSSFGLELCSLWPLWTLELYMAYIYLIPFNFRMYSTILILYTKFHLFKVIRRCSYKSYIFHAHLRTHHFANNVSLVW